MALHSSDGSTGMFVLLIAAYTFFVIEISRLVETVITNSDSFGPAVALIPICALQGYILSLLSERLSPENCLSSTMPKTQNCLFSTMPNAQNCVFEASPSTKSE
jgi:hypothetical protein